MPGILPMKVIKVGTSAQSRIAQACDRCRSKKIRCDGVTPCCTQCANVGFECKTSDKLSRRAFPRGYTESLEERVRSLETEVKELKTLLDEKDEKIDLLSKIHSNSPSLRRPSSTSSSSTDLADIKKSVTSPSAGEDVFRVSQSPCLLDGEGSDSYLMGASSSRSFIDCFRVRAQEIGKSCGEFRTESFFAPKKKPSSPSKRLIGSNVPILPSRMVADHLINIYFQEWAPLFPLIHKPTVLKVYTEYVADPESVKDKHDIAVLNLIFSIAILSAEGNKQPVNMYETQWQRTLDQVLEENTLSTLQCLVLAQLFCIAKADYSKLLYYKGLAVSMSHRLGLHQSQKRFSLGALTSESRKRVFWTLYTLDCFSAALLGLPKLMNEGDVHAEYPVDIDDENISERGFQSTLPGEYTRVSSALALFRLSRLMSKVLEEIYPAAPYHDISLQRVGSLNSELDEWLEGLPAHLRLHFVQDKPSTDVTGSRSPLLSLGYHYVRTLIHRPAIGSSLGNKASSSVITVAQSSKHIVQIIQLLQERKMSFSFCLNKNEISLLAGFGLLFQCLNLDRRSKIVQDSQRILCSVVDLLERNSAPGAAEFKNVTCAIISVWSVNGVKKTARQSEDAMMRRKSDGTMHAPKTVMKSARKLQAIASRFSPAASPEIKSEPDKIRRATAPTVSMGSIAYYARSNSQSSVSSIVSDPMPHRGLSDSVTASQPARQTQHLKAPNLDYLSFSIDQTPSPHEMSRNVHDAHKNIPLGGSSSYDLDMLATPSLDNPFSSDDLFNSYLATPPDGTIDWSPDAWNMPAHIGTQHTTAPSFSEEEITSGEELSSCEAPQDMNTLSMRHVDDLGGNQNSNQNFGLSGV